MSKITELINKLNQEDEEINKMYESNWRHLYESCEVLKEKLDQWKKLSSQAMENLSHVTANRPTIEKALEHTDDKNILPIPCEHHEAVVEGISKIAEFINGSAENKPNPISPVKIYEDVVSATNAIADDLMECQSSFMEGQSLCANVKLLKERINYNLSDSMVHEDIDF